MNESRILAETLVAVTALPDTIAWRNQIGAASVVRTDGSISTLRFGLPGSADIIGCSRGRAIAIECKTETGRQSPRQKRFQAAWEAAGGIYVVARSAAQAVEALR